MHSFHTDQQNVSEIAASLQCSRMRVQWAVSANAKKCQKRLNFSRVGFVRVLWDWVLHF